jgi:hypothetical protein
MDAMDGMDSNLHRSERRSSSKHLEFHLTGLAGIRCFAEAHAIPTNAWHGSTYSNSIHNTDGTESPAVS